MSFIDLLLVFINLVESLHIISMYLFFMWQPEPEFRPPMSEVVEALVRLVQRANMSKRTFGVDQASPRGEADAQDYEP